MVRDNRSSRDDLRRPSVNESNQRDAIDLLTHHKNTVIPTILDFTTNSTAQHLDNLSDVAAALFYKQFAA